MMRPTPDQERWLLVTARHAPAHRDELRSGGWHQVGLLTRVLLFVLGVVIAAMLVAIAALLEVRPVTLLPGMISIVAAEAMIARRKLSHCGIEEALELAGLALLAFWLVDVVFVLGDVEVIAAMAIALSIAAWRLRNALFTTLAALAASLCLYLVLSKLPNGLGIRHQVTALFCYAVAWAALALGGFQYRRPSLDHSLNWLVVSMPLAGYFWSAELTLFSARHTISVDAMAMPILFGLSALWTGLQRRQHAPLLACMMCVACLAYELRWVSGWSLTQRLLIWGAATLLLALCLDRWLRKPVRGITAKPVNDDEASLELLQLAGAALITPKPSSPEPGFKGEGGGFGGGGASGKF